MHVRLLSLSSLSGPSDGRGQKRTGEGQEQGGWASKATDTVCLLCARQCAYPEDTTMKQNPAFKV